MNVFKGNTKDFKEFARAGVVKGNYNERQLKYYNWLNGFNSRSLPAAIKAANKSRVAEVFNLFANGEQGAWYDPTLPNRDFSEELTVNGTFDTDTGWSKETGWSISGGVAVHTATGAGSLYQGSIGLSEGDMCRITLEVTNYVGGTLTPFIRGTNSGVGITANGTYEIFVEAGTDSIYAINLFADASFDATVDNVSVKRVDNYSQWLSQTTLYQDSAGTTPVQNDGDPVGLMLDKSQGLVLGPELVTNGDFNTLDGWKNFPSLPFDTFEVVGGELHAISDGSSRCLAGGDASNTFSVSSVGNTVVYKAQLRVVSGGSPVIRLNVFEHLASADNNVLLITSGNGVGVYDLEVKVPVSTTSNIHVTFEQPNGVAGEWYVDNISVRELPGNHATQSASASKRLYRTDGTLHWLEDDLFDDAIIAHLPDLGTNATLAYADGAGVTILIGQTISGDTNLPTVSQTYGVIYLDRPLIASETENVTAYLNKLRGV